MSWNYNSVTRLHPARLPMRVSGSSMSAGYVRGNQKSFVSRANALNTAKTIAPIVNSPAALRRKEIQKRATPPSEPVLISAGDQHALLKVQPESLTVKQGEAVVLQLDLPDQDIELVEWRAFTEASDDLRIVRNRDASMTDIPVADTVYNVLLQVRERRAALVAIVGHHFEVSIRVV